MSPLRGLLNVFPIPYGVAMPAAGVDISQTSVKYVMLSDHAGHLALRSFGVTPLPAGAVVAGDIEQEDRVIDVLRTLRLRSGVHYANAALPEKKAYLYTTLVPAGSKSLRAGVEFDFEPVRVIEAGTIVAVTAFARRIVDSYRSVFKKAGITLRALEVESQALARAALTEADKNATLMMIDFGKYTTRIAIVENCVVVFTATVDVGGGTLTEAIMKRMNVAEPEAEKIKNEKGFLMSADNKDLVETLMSTVSVVKDEIVKHLSYWNSPSADDLPRRPVERVIICGGNANLRGFPEYLEGFLNVPVIVANVWSNAFTFDRYVPQMPFPQSLEYATAIGLAIRGTTKRVWK
jgi:type IV pilus assembly protein PilM